MFPLIRGNCFHLSKFLLTTAIPLCAQSYSLCSQRFVHSFIWYTVIYNNFSNSLIFFNRVNWRTQLLCTHWIPLRRDPWQPFQGRQKTEEILTFYDPRLPLQFNQIGLQESNSHVSHRQVLINHFFFIIHCLNTSSLCYYKSLPAVLTS